MITYEKRNELWVRHDRQKSKMSIAEVRTAITATQELAMRVEALVERRKQIVSAERPLSD